MEIKDEFLFDSGLIGYEKKCYTEMKREFYQKTLELEAHSKEKACRMAGGNTNGL